MYPVIYDFGNINLFGFSFNPVINSYGFMLMTAFYLCYFFLSKELKRLGYNSNLAGDESFRKEVEGLSERTKSILAQEIQEIRRGEK